MNKVDELGTEKMSKLLFKQSAPAIVGCFSVILYEILDSIFISRGVSAIAFAGVMLVSPLYFLFSVASELIGTGTSSMISRALGRRDVAYANKSFGNMIFSGIIFSILIPLAVLMFSDEILMSIGASEATLPFAKDYLIVIALGSFFRIFSNCSNDIVRAEGNARRSMQATILGVFINLILDPIFIFILNLGVKGAAVATVISWGIAFLYQFFYFLKSRGVIRLVLDNIRFNLKMSKEMFAIGTPSSLMNMGESVLYALINILLLKYGGDLAIAAYGIVFMLMLCVFRFAAGMSQGFQPIAGYNFGAKNYVRVRDSLLKATFYTTSVCFLCFLCFYLFAEPLVSIFTEKQELITLTMHALYIMIIPVTIIGVQMVAATFFESIGKPLPSFLISLFRQLIFAIPALLTLPHFFGLDGVWWALVISEIAASIFSILILIRAVKRLNKHISYEKSRG